MDSIFHHSMRKDVYGRIGPEDFPVTPSIHIVAFLSHCYVHKLVHLAADTRVCQSENR